MTIEPDSEGFLDLIMEALNDEFEGTFSELRVFGKEKEQ